MAVKVTGLKKQSYNAIGIGVFDGIHKGHQEIWRQVDALLTFFPHPAVTLGRVASIDRLTTLREMRYLISNLLVLFFTKSVSELSPEDFLEKIVLEKINPKKIVVGEDFGFGYQKKGTLQYLKAWARAHDIEVVVVSLLPRENHIVKSSWVRECILEGNVPKAIALMGHPYLIIGTVIAGEGRGKSLGFPTANLHIPGYKLVPANGVYGGYCEIDNHLYRCLIYIGTKPTFQYQKRSIEVYILDFNNDLYGRQIAVFMTQRCRPDQLFENVTALRQQIQKDSDAIRKIPLGSVEKDMVQKRLKKSV